MSASGITDDQHLQRNGYNLSGGIGNLGVIVPTQFNSQGGLKTNQSTDLLRRNGADDVLAGSAAAA